MWIVAAIVATVPLAAYAAGRVDVAAPQSAAGPVVTNGQIRDDYALADFRSHSIDASDPTLTLITHVIVAVNMEQIQSPGAGWQSTPDVRVSIYQNAFRAGDPSAPEVFEVQAGNDAGYANLVLDYGATRDLGAATLHGVFTGTNVLTRQPVEVAVDISWTATGALVVSRDHVHNVDPGLFVGIVHGTDWSRIADASGSVTLAGTNYTDLPTTHGLIGTGQGGIHDTEAVRELNVNAAPQIVQQAQTLKATVTPKRSTWGEIKSLYR